MNIYNIFKITTTFKLLLLLIKKITKHSIYVTLLYIYHFLIRQKKMFIFLKSQSFYAANIIKILQISCSLKHASVDVVLTSVLKNKSYYRSYFFNIEQ